ncbi:Os01g0503400 [Oryza sativa Japonica Group]|uniref:Os01g0503400 protein n=1 Tax=Oryza sativa subsp. japonica TaxID=39947 RepID=A0A0N7KD13_ORYSJ|nr:hypothetical protein EE612_002902 [Oryza sativa]BAS72337.1 Os01g0503400 [Oryza sativa Japonica Group]
MEEGAKIGREHEQQQQQHGRVNGSGRVAAVGGGSGGGGDEIEIEVAAAAGASPSRQHGGLHGDVQAPTWKRFLAHVGPGFVISIAYLDPSNCKSPLSFNLPWTRTMPVSAHQFVSIHPCMVRKRHF